ncbi:MAG: response regulator transcription factor [Fibrobacteres bacterium]|nr:response regulator transcription factor [Fibrobacterota bacterium]
MRFRAVLVEDEESSRNRLRRLLEEFHEDLEIVGEAADGPAAMAIIKSARPDLLFLDIGLPGMDGFEVLEKLERQPVVIFTTTHNNRALEAFKTMAVDYLLKPIDADALKGSIEKLRALGFNQGQFSRAIQELMGALGGQYISRITCKIGDKLAIVKTAEIIYFHSENKYTSIHTSSREFLEDTPLVELEKKLNPKDFVRIHRSTIVNISWIAEIQKLYDGKMKVVMKDGKATQLFASRLFADNLRNL